MAKKTIKKTHKYLYWTPRIISIIFIAFLTLFSFDVFGEGLGFWQAIGAFLMHNIPSFLLIAVLAAAWRYEWVGAVFFALAGLAYVIMVMMGDVPWYLALSWSMIIAGPAFIIAALFYLNWIKKK